jgi:hypothetical protein
MAVIKVLDLSIDQIAKLKHWSETNGDYLKVWEDGFIAGKKEAILAMKQWINKPKTSYPNQQDNNES